MQIHVEAVGNNPHDLMFDEVILKVGVFAQNTDGWIDQVFALINLTDNSDKDAESTDEVLSGCSLTQNIASQSISADLSAEV